MGYVIFFIVLFIIFCLDHEADDALCATLVLWTPISIVHALAQLT